MQIRLFSEVTLFKYYVSTILSPIVCNLQSTVLRSHPKLNYGGVIIYRAKLIDISDHFHKLASFGAEDVFRPCSLNPNTPQQGGRKKSTLYGPVVYTRSGGGAGGGVPFKRGTFFRLQVHEDIGVRNSVISVCKKPKRAN